MLQTSMFSYYTKIKRHIKCSAWADEQNEEWGTLNLLSRITESLAFQHATLQTNFLGNSFLCVGEKHEKWAWRVPVCGFSRAGPSGWTWRMGSVQFAFTPLLGTCSCTLVLGAELTGELFKMGSPVTLLGAQSTRLANKIRVNLNKWWDAGNQACLLHYAFPEKASDVW